MTRPSKSATSISDINAEIFEGKRFENEEIWVSYQPFLFSRGYKLRPRYSPDWQPSWKLAGVKSLENCLYEDAITAYRADVVMDAIRMADNCHIVLKKVKTSSEELKIAQFLSSPDIGSDPRNHSVPIFEIIHHPDDKDVTFLVMPVLLEMDYLPFRRLGEFAEAVRQYLTGLQFMHDNNIAHRDPCHFNLMVDATLIPGGFHFFLPDTTDGVNRWTVWRERSSVKSLRYHYIDFGLSRQYSTNVGVLDVGILGQDQSYPERSATIPYDPFKTDIYQLGNVILGMVKEYDGLEFFSKIGEAMTRKIPEDRASIPELLTMIDTLKPRKLKRRVWSKYNSKLSRFLMQYFGYNFPI
ncbi:hypothetical protein H0H93_001465 [Arthromyces matolae]|nr:hypothetical protein H0H93_001465 [Arthromyces matolae]